MVSIAGQIVLVTGASSGIGAASARAFAAAGARVIVAARRIDRIRSIAAGLHTEFGVDTLPLELDVRSYAQVAGVLGDLPEPWPAIDILLNNAGLSRGLDKLHEGALEDWDEMIDANVKGLLYVTRTVLPGMVARGHGHVINIGSIAGHQVYPGGNVYCASKAAVNMLSHGIRMDVLGTGVRVSSVEPGLVETEFSEVRFRGDKERAAKVYAGTRPLTGEDVANVVVYCALQPPHVDIAQVVLMPTDQASVFHVHRRP
jgi:3-hydroxy acid dehydrogenase/malonic semialdehyde reductase